MQKLSRREALRGTGVAALAAGAAVIPTMGLALEADPHESAMKELWAKFIAAEVAWYVAHDAEQSASSAVDEERDALPSVWTPWPALHYKWVWDTSAEDRYVGERRTIETVRQLEGSGHWLVREFLPSGRWGHNKRRIHEDKDPERSQAYPDAKTAEEALTMSQARAEREWRSHAAKRAAISRKHDLTRLKAALDQAEETITDLRCDIARAVVSGPFAIAIKIALWAHDECLSGNRVSRIAADLDNEGRYDVIETVALWSVYASAVASCRFDPLREAQAAVGYSPDEQDARKAAA